MRMPMVVMKSTFDRSTIADLPALTIAALNRDSTSPTPMVSSRPSSSTCFTPPSRSLTSIFMTCLSGLREQPLDVFHEFRVARCDVARIDDDLLARAVDHILVEVPLWPDVGRLCQALV